MLTLEYIYLYTRRIRYGAVVALAAALLLGNAAAAQAGPTPTPLRPATTKQAPSGKTTPTPARAMPAAGDGEDGSWTVQDAIRFWTPERIASATDPSGRDAQPQGWTAPHTKQSLTATDGEHFDGIKSVGTLFSQSKDMKAHYCSASVVNSGGHNLILTAGHCLGDKAAFVPKYDDTKSAGDQPYGIWPVKEWFRDSQYASDRSAKSDLDFSFASLKEDGGRQVQDVVGANKLARTPGFVNQVTVIGYPSVAHNTQDRAFRCRDIWTTPLPAYNQMQIDCGGMWGGVSGGPWFSKFDSSGETGEIIGNVGGFMGGGPDVPSSSPLYNRITYSPLHGDRFFQLYDDAQQGLHTDHGPYHQPALPYSMGDGNTWKHAQQMAAGDFNGAGHSDLLVVWTDGEATLYTNDGQGHFITERQLLAPNSTWSHAQTITAGDFTGSNQFDLMVRWSDGEVTLYGDIGTNGLNVPGTQLAAPHTIWEHATQIAAGRFIASTYVTDLMVRWSDGELTLYTNVGAGGFGQEHKLQDPNSIWTQATLLTAGEYSGNQKWDLMVQWSDGEIDNYVGTTTSALGTEARIQNPNDLWTHNAVMTTGSFTTNHRTDDLIIRWSDGETTMYADTGSKTLGTEHNLVPHA
ncbi:trypsin-like serine peptidase [Streptomyces sp. PsTaAH-124]|uniref:trypsin-like serine peptidase n=1 Tax=Streptomyces sp. PsTaAH-124 TaxID=1157638 RepID=UPI001F1D4692|nr:FG-GAP-like repeat-containing protein [Streptomyces sp. PsTaAH-124]